MKSLRTLLAGLLLLLAMSIGNAATLSPKIDPTVTGTKVTLVAMCKVANADCPEDLGDGLSLESVHYNDPNVEFVFKGDFKKSDFEYLQSNSDQIYDAFVKTLKEDPDCSKVIALCKSSKSNLVLIFKNKKGQKYELKVEYTKL